MPRKLTYLAAALAALAIPSSAAAAPAVDGSFPTSGPPKYLATGPDGNVWFTLASSSGSKEFGRIAPDGTVTEYDSPNNQNGANGIALGPDGNLWIAESQKVVRVNPANPSAGQSFPVTDLGDPRGITGGPDGNVWAASGDKAIKIAPGTGAVLDLFTVAGMGARGITAGGDGNLWIADFGSGRIVKITPAGVPTPYPVGGGPQEVARGPAGQLAFTNPSDTLGRITYSGTVQPTAMPGTDPTGVVLGQDGAYWTAQFASNSVGRVTPAGAYTQLPLPPGSGPRYIARGAGGTLWVGLETSQRIARISGVTAPVTPPATDPVAPVVRRLRATPKRFVRRTTLRYTSTEAGRAVLRIQRVRTGRRRKGSCVKPTKALRKAPKCTRYTTIRTLTRKAKAGPNAHKLTRRLRGKATLKPGRYRVVATVRDAAGNRSQARRTRFTVVRAR